MRFRSMLTVALMATLSGAVVATALIALPSATAQTSERVAKPRTFVSGWMPYWLPESSTSSVVANAALFDTASPFVFDVQAATNIDLQITADQWTTMRTRLRNAGVPIVPTLATDLTADEFAALLSNDVRRQAHIDALAKLAKRYNLRGLDLDYESINFGSSAAKKTVRDLYPVFVDALEARLQNQGRMLTVTVASRTSVNDPNWMVFDYAALGAAADGVRVMTYDFHWSGGAPGPMAPKWWVDDVMAFATDQIPSSKVSVGLPAYGRDWFVEKMSGHCPASARAPISRSTASMNTFARQRGITPQWRETATSRTFTYIQKYSADGSTCRVKRVAWFDDSRSVKEKTALVRKYELRGVALWALGYETDAMWDNLRDFGRVTAMRQPSVRVHAPERLDVGDRGVVRSRVVDGSEDVARHGVTLQRRFVGSDRWVNVKKMKTDGDGKAAFEVAPRKHVRWRVVSSASWQYHRAMSSVYTTRTRA